MIPKGLTSSVINRASLPALTTDEVALLRAWVDQGAECPAGVLLASPKIEKQR